MRLEIGNFYVQEIKFGEKTEYHNGILTVNEEEAIAALNPDGRLKDIKLHIVHPGDAVRILPVKEIVEPRAKEGGTVFPGYTGEMKLAGDGKLCALKGMAVTAVGKYGCAGDGMLDMSGEAAELTHFAKLIHLCFTARNADGSEEDPGTYKKNTDYRRGAHLLAEYLGKTVLGKAPEELEVYDNSQQVSTELPRIAMVLQISTAFTKEPGLVNRLYGQDTVYLVPPLLNPNEILDGALTGDTLFFASFKLYTYDYQNMPMIKELYKEHGKTLNFVGAILDVNPPVADLKVRGSDRIAVIAERLGLDGAIVMGTANGHSEIDFFTTIAKLEQEGIKCVGHCMESPGHGGGMQSKVILDPRANAIVSDGADHAILNLPAMPQVIGDLESIGRDGYPGAWAYDPEYGPSLHEDGSITVDTLMICGQDGNAGWSNKVCKNY